MKTDSVYAKTRDVKRISDLEMIKAALEIYHQEDSVYPKDLKELDDKHFSRGIPVDPKTSESYDYQRLSDTNVKVCAMLEEEREDRKNPYCLSPSP